MLDYNHVGRKVGLNIFHDKWDIIESKQSVGRQWSLKIHAISENMMHDYMLVSYVK